MNTKESQSIKILQYLMLGVRLNAKEALRMFGTMKLSTRVGEIEKDYSVRISRERIKGTLFMEYWMPNKTK